MTHTHTTPPQPRSPDPKAARIADLSEEWFTADPARREAIGAEIAGLIEGKVAPLERKRSSLIRPRPETG